MDWLVLVGAFLGFMALLGGVRALDRFAAQRFGYRPFAPPNLAFMLLPHGVFCAWLTGHLALDSTALPPSAAPAPVFGVERRATRSRSRSRGALCRVAPGRGGICARSRSSSTATLPR